MKKPNQSPRTKITHSNATGFTLIELIFATVLLGLMLTLTMQTFIALLRFYSWANVTRTNQAAARQTMDDLTRQIQSNQINSGVSTASTLCVITDSSANPKSTQYSLQTTATASQIVEQTYPSTDCTGGSSSPQAITPTAEKISKLTFSIAKSPASAPPYSLAGGVVIDMTMINTTVAGATSCQPGDNFCGLADLTTAVQAQGGVK